MSLSVVPVRIGSFAPPVSCKQQLCIKQPQPNNITLTLVLSVTGPYLLPILAGCIANQEIFYPNFAFSVAYYGFNLTYIPDSAALPMFQI
jgi:hypothetical protein